MEKYRRESDGTLCSPVAFPFNFMSSNFAFLLGLKVVVVVVVEP